tara:strand:- start:836 stop:1123 length:288 start_codon:yes stop_codon:yes gene_type:complete
METDETALKRWGRVVDVVESGVLYMEDAERLVLQEVKFPASPDKRAQAEALLMDLVSDKIIYYSVSGVDSLGRLESRVWVDDVEVNKLMIGKGFG